MALVEDVVTVQQGTWGGEQNTDYIGNNKSLAQREGCLVLFHMFSAERCMLNIEWTESKTKGKTKSRTYLNNQNKHTEDSQVQVCSEGLYKADFNAASAALFEHQAQGCCFIYSVFQRKLSRFILAFTLIHGNGSAFANYFPNACVKWIILFFLSGICLQPFTYSLFW